MMSHTAQTEQEQEVRQALAAYKMALIRAHYENAWHRFLCWLGDKEALDANRQLQQIKSIAISTVNRSEDHKRHLRVISSQQPDYVREQDRFLNLIQKV